MLDSTGDVQFIEARLIVPRRPNKGDMRTTQYHQRRRILETQLLRAFGGFTRTSVKGAWLDEDEGKVYWESGFMYLLDFSTLNGKACEFFEDLRDTVKALLNQKAVFLSYVTLEDAPIQ